MRGGCRDVPKVTLQRAPAGPELDAYRAIVNSPSPEDVDARGDRVVQSAIGVLLLAGFVFRWPWLIPILGLILAVGAIAGPHANPFHLAFRRLMAPRFSTPEAPIDPVTIRLQDALLAGLCALASLMFLAGLTPVGWLLVVAAAVAAIVAATIRVHLGDQLRRFTGQDD